MKAPRHTLTRTGPLAVLLFVLTLVPAPPADAQLAATCGDRATVLAQLASKYKEAPVNMGLANNGAVMEVLASDEGSWTVILTSPQGITCMVAAGQHWEPVERKKVGYAPSADTKIH